MARILDEAGLLATTIADQLGHRPGHRGEGAYRPQRATNHEAVAALEAVIDLD